MHTAFFYCNTHIVTCNMRAISMLRCNIDSFLLNQKGLDSMSILPKNFCNMHIALLLVLACCTIVVCRDSRKHMLHRDVSHFYSVRKKGSFIFFRSILKVWKSTNLTFVKYISKSFLKVMNVSAIFNSSYTFLFFA